MKTIVSVRYVGCDGVMSGREYSYFTDIPLELGNLVVCPSAKGDGQGVVTAVNVPESKIDERVLPKLRTIERKAEETE